MRVGDLLARLRVGPGALDDGRVFIGKKRCLRPERPLGLGEVVTIEPGAAPESPDARAGVRILRREGGWIAAYKPAGLSTVPDQRGHAESLVHRVAELLGVEMSAVHPLSRLDRLVSGVVPFALDEATRERSERARERGQYEREYVAIAHAPEGLAPEGAIDLPIGRGKTALERQVHGDRAKPSCTLYRVCAQVGEYVLVRVRPITGRTHQIRVHFAAIGAPLVGDRVYGGPRERARPDQLRRVALHAMRVALWGDERLLFSAESDVPAELRAFWRRLGGEDEAWEIPWDEA